jgi:hypothetical protein
MTHEYEPFDPAVAAKQERKRRREAAKIAAEKREWWHAALSTEVGRREIFALINQAGAFRLGNAHFPAGESESATFYHLGQADFGRAWFQHLEFHHTELAILMRAENDPIFAQARQPEPIDDADADVQD